MGAGFFSPKSSLLGGGHEKAPPWGGEKVKCEEVKTPFLYSLLLPTCPPYRPAATPPPGGALGAEQATMTQSISKY